ncbi:MAG: MFS transporter [Alphaproteobacteria bacterium]|nr:MFS transporter [Alphaproteobacteria bacterium]
MTAAAQSAVRPSTQTVAVLTGASVMLTMSMGMRQSFGLFVAPTTQDLGIAVADFTLALAVQNFVWGLTQPFIGALADRYGCRVVSVLGSLLFAAGLVVTMAATGPIGLMIGLGVLIGLAMACTALSLALAASARAVSAAKRSVVLGGVSAAGSIGTFIAAPLAQSLIESHGWQMALVGFLGLCAVMLPAAFFAGAGDKTAPPRAPGIVDVDEGLTLKGVLAEAAAHRGYVVMAVAFFVCGLQLVFLTTHLPAYLALCGQSPALGAQALGVIGAFNALGCYLLGWLGGKFPKHVLLGWVYILRSCFIVAYFMLPATPASTLIFAAVMGLLWLGVAPLVNGLIVQIFGLRYVATLSGIAFFSHQAGSFLGAWGGGLLFDMLGSYDLAWQIGVAIGMTAGIFQVFMDDRPTARVAAAQA